MTSGIRLAVLASVPGRTGKLRRLQHDLRQARRVQRRLLPSVPRDLDRLHLAVAYQPAYEVGGDFYDWVRVGPSRLVCIVGDVSGKGVAGALLMSWLSAEYFNAARRERTPGRILEALNERVIALDQQDAFVTALCLDIDAERRSVVLANAGHIPAVRLCSPSDLSEIGLASGAPLGVVAGQRYAEDSCELSEGDILLLATDGVTEALSGDASFLCPRLRELAAAESTDPRHLAALLAATATRDGLLERSDDVTVVALKLAGGRLPGSEA